MSVVGRDGKLLQAFGSPGTEPGLFQLLHDIAVASNGDVYLGEITDKA